MVGRGSGAAGGAKVDILAAAPSGMAGVVASEVSWLHEGDGYTFKIRRAVGKIVVYIEISHKRKIKKKNKGKHMQKQRVCYYSL